jgi:hypothetical protein
VKFDPTAISYAKETEITFFREILPEGHDLARKKTEIMFFMKADPTTMI